MNETITREVAQKKPSSRTNDLPGDAVGAAPQTSAPAPREIMMVEDRGTDAELVARAFKLADIANPLQTFSSSEAGLDYLFGTGPRANQPPGRPQLILLDLNLPGMSGVEFLRCIKEDERTRDIPVVVLTHSEGDRNIMTCVRLGSDGYIVKPLDVETLFRVTSKLNVLLSVAASPAEPKKALRF